MMSLAGLVDGACLPRLVGCAVPLTSKPEVPTDRRQLLSPFSAVCASRAISLDGIFTQPWVYFPDDSGP